MDGLDTIDRVAIFLGTGLMFLGTVVLGFVETLTGQPRFPVATEGGEVVAYGTFGPMLRTGLVVAGLVVLLVYAGYKLAMPAEPATDDTTDVSTAD
jgi:hypothetical protein